MFISPFSVSIKTSDQFLNPKPQPMFSGFNTRGSLEKAAKELDEALIQAEDTIETEGKSKKEIEIAAETARKKYDTKPYELKFIKALAQDVADHFKNFKGTLPPIPAGKMVKNAIAWIVAYRKDGGFNINSYKPPSKTDPTGSIYKELLRSKANTIPWPVEETEEQKAGWPISDTPITDLQNIFDTELTKLIPKTRDQKTNTPVPVKKESTSARSANRQKPKIEAKPPSGMTPALANAAPPQTIDAKVQTSPDTLSISPFMQTGEIVPSKPRKTHDAKVQTTPSILSISPFMQTEEILPSPPPKTSDAGVQASWKPRKIALTPAIAPTSPYIATVEPNVGADDIVDWDTNDLDQALVVEDLLNLTRSKAGTKPLYTWFNSEYKGDDPDQRTIAFSRLMRDLRDPKRPVNEDNLFTYLKAEGPASPEPTSESQEKRKRKFVDSPTISS